MFYVFKKIVKISNFSTPPIPPPKKPQYW